MNQLLSASNLGFGYSGKPVLRDIALTLTAGELVCLLGPNGSGKTTLIRALLGHLKATGSIQWDSRALSSWSRRELSKRVAYLPQTPTYEPGQTVGEVLRLGRAPYWKAFGVETNHDIEVVQRIAETLQLTQVLDRRINLLSGGQRQRIFIGRCLVQEPAAMLLDEPNTFLDLKYQIELGQLLRKLAKEQNIAVLMASHDVNLAATFADRLLLLADGKLCASGTADEVLKPEILTEVYGVKMNRVDVGTPSRAMIFPDAAI